MLSTAHQHAYRQYRSVQTQTASPGYLVVMLYQGAIAFASRAQAALDAGDCEAAHENLIRTQDIIAELLGSLDFGQGEVASNLARLYEYMHRRLVEANVCKSAEPVAEVLRHLRLLCDAWQQAVAQVAACEQRKLAPATVRPLAVVGSR
jgi:flagellar protein FliS